MQKKCRSNKSQFEEISYQLRVGKIGIGRKENGSRVVRRRWGCFFCIALTLRIVEMFYVSNK